jgi:hypothetical protein
MAAHMGALMADMRALTAERDALAAAVAELQNVSLMHAQCAAELTAAERRASGRIAELTSQNAALAAEVAKLTARCGLVAKSATATQDNAVQSSQRASTHARTSAGTHARAHTRTQARNAVVARQVGRSSRLHTVLSGYSRSFWVLE